MHRRTNKDIRTSILSSLSSAKSINEIASAAAINWHTTELHLNYLKGRELVKEIFHHHKLRIFELTEKGKKSVKNE